MSRGKLIAAKSGSIVYNEPEKISRLERLEQLRASASLDRTTFALRAAKAGFVTYDEAAQWVAGNSLPTPVQEMLDAMPGEQRGEALVTALGAQNIRRNDPLMIALIAAFDTDDAGADALFGADQLCPHRRSLLI